MSRLRAGRHPGTIPPLGEWELVFAWGGNCTHDKLPGAPCPHGAGIGCWSKFASEEDRADAWFVLRDDLLHSLNDGFRPPAFWYYEAESLCSHEPRCGRWPKDELAWLVAHGEATPRERRMHGKGRADGPELHGPTVGRIDETDEADDD